MKNIMILINRILLIIYLMISTNCLAQTSRDLHVHYNFFDETIVFERNGKELSRPTVKNGSNVYVHVKEFNPYLYRGQLKCEEKIINPNQVNFFGGGGDSYGASNYNGGGMGFLNLPTFNSQIAEGEKQKLQNRKSRSGPPVSVYSSQYKSLLNELEESEKLLDENLKALELIGNSEMIRQIALNEVQTIKTNPMIRPTEMGQIAKDYIESSFGFEIGQNISVNDLIKGMKVTDNYASLRYEASSALGSYEDIVMQLDRLNEQMSYEDIETADFVGLQEMVTGSNKVLHSNLTRLRDGFQGLPEYVSNGNIDIGALSTLKREYEEFVSHDYILHFPPFQAEGDEVELSMTFRDKTTGDDIKIVEQKVNVAGGIKINAGVGLTFGSFLDDRFDYDVRSDTIVSTPVDQFVPMLTSFIHFYGQPRGNVGIGGTFGIGVPFLNNNEVQSATYFLGPSLIIGKMDRVILTGGLFGGRVTRLANEFEIGDEFLSDGGDIPTVTPYELGWFVGLSYNFLGS